MRFIEVKYKNFTFQFKMPFRISNQLFSHKDVIILKARDDLGNIHLGEVSPLTGFSKERIIDCERELQYLEEKKLLEIDIDEIRKKVIPSIKNHSLKFGIEQLLFSLDLSQQRIIVAKDCVIKTNALLGIQPFQESINQIEDFLINGFETIKIKTGKNNFEETVKILQHFQNLSNGLKFRIDNNASWDYDTALTNAKMLGNLNVEYLEQPVNEMSELKVLSKNTVIPIVPDESVSSFEVAKKIIEAREFNCIILKPSIRIGIYDSMKLIQLANDNNIKIIITSAFETAIGRSLLLLMATMVNHNLAHGLNTELLGQDVISSEINYQNPTIYLSNKTPHVNLIHDF